MRLPVGSDPQECLISASSRLEPLELAADPGDFFPVVGAPGGGSDPVAQTLHRSVRPYVELEVIIPAYNEERRLAATLQFTLSYLKSQPYSSAVVVVDNGSVDYTAEIADRFLDATLPVYVVGCAQPGKGSAVRRGLRTGSSRYVGYLDADGSTPIATLDTVHPLLERGAVCVVASRRASGGGFAVPQSRLRRTGSEGFRVLSKGLVRGVHDTQCGFKFFRGDVIREIAGDTFVDGFAFDLELLSRLQRAGQDVVEVPVTWTDAHGSTFRPVRHGSRAARDVLALRRALSSWTPT